MRSGVALSAPSSCDIGTGISPTCILEQGYLGRYGPTGSFLRQRALAPGGDTLEAAPARGTVTPVTGLHHDRARPEPRQGGPP
jgi:hypothetical protein